MSTFRDDVVSHLASIAQTYATANPTLLRRVWRAQPGSFAELPAVFIANRPETIEADAGTLRRTIETAVVVIDAYTSDAEQTVDRMDVVVDALVSALALDANAHVGGGIIDVGGVVDGDLPIQSTSGMTLSYRSASIAIVAIVQEGRN